MNQKMLLALAHLGHYARGDINRRSCLGCLVKVGYSEQTAIFLLEILENCVDDPYDKIANPVPARPELEGEEKQHDL